MNKSLWNLKKKKWKTKIIYRKKNFQRNCLCLLVKHITRFARWLKWFWMQVAISPTFYDQLFYTQASLYTDSLGRYFFGKRKSAKKLLLKCWWICLQGRDLTFRYTRQTNNKFTIWNIRDRLERPYLRYNSPKSSTIEHIIFCSLCGLRVMVFLSPIFRICDWK